jgi:hypothetical protein
MDLNKIYTDSQFAESVIPDGSMLVFLGYSNGVSGSVVWRCKKSDGTFANLASSNSGGGGGSGGASSADELTIADAGNYFEATTVEGALQELASEVKSANDILNEV